MSKHKITAKEEYDMSHIAIHDTMGLQEWLIVLALSIMWGGSFFFIGVAVIEIPPLYVVLSRVGLAAGLLLAVMYARGYTLPRSWKIWGYFFVMGALNNVLAFGLTTWGQSQIESGLSLVPQTLRQPAMWA